jgi:hypothetical protein
VDSSPQYLDFHYYTFSIVENDQAQHHAEWRFQRDMKRDISYTRQIRSTACMAESLTPGRREEEVEADCEGPAAALLL